MSALGLVLTIALCGFLLWLIETYIPMSPPIQTLLRVVVVVLVIVFLLQFVGFDLGHSVRVFR